MTIEVTRAGLVESVHTVHWVVTDAAGKVVDGEGEHGAPVFPRSSTKPFQAMAVIVGGAADAFGLTDPEIAVVAGSHHGEPCHLEAVCSILGKIGATAEDLQCGIHPPANTQAQKALRDRGEAPNALHNNCSGKHAGILALARHLDAPLETYMERGHPAQQVVFRTMGAILDMGPDEIPYGYDGCSLPAAAVPLRNTAMGFARFATSEGLQPPLRQAATRLRTAEWKNPVMINGTEGFDFQVMQAAPRLVVKGGAEGVFCAGDAVSGHGLALKVTDGTYRALPVAATELMRRLGWLDAAALEALACWHSPVIKTLAGREAGTIRVAEDGSEPV